MTSIIKFPLTLSQAATSMQIVTLAFSNPEWAGADVDFERVNGSISFQDLITFDIRTLSTGAGPPGSDLTGLIYTPDLPPDFDQCREASAPYVPANVTRQANLPDVNYDLVGVAPFLSPECVQAYMQAAREDPIRALVFFPPDNSTAPPPEPDDPYWALGDDGNWRKNTGFALYAISGDTGNRLLKASSEYSGNMTDVPWGSELTEIYDVRDYVRLFARVDTSGGSSLPSLWVFLLVVLGILLFVIATTSLCMHWLQRRRRSALRERVANGEVDLEALGIKRLTVPQDVLDKMPLYTYGTGAPVAPPSLARDNAALPAVARDKLASADSSRPTSPDPAVRPAPAERATSYRPSPLQQPTCAICLDDFVAATSDNEGTIVRELPCHHIFHPECVDTFLRDSSSLCPMCKKSALPKGYCPRVVTNAMVRRERMLRRIRPNADVENDGGAANAAPPVLESRFTRMSRRITSGPSSGVQRSQEMSELQSSPSTTQARSGVERATMQRPPVQPADNATRREWARQRALAMVGGSAPLDPDVEEARTTPRWKKALRNVFPGFGGGGRARGNG